MVGNTCEQGGFVIYNCKDCGSNYYNTLDSHNVDYTVVDLGLLGLGCGGKVEVYVCKVCKITTGCYAQTNCQWDHRKDTEAGVSIYVCRTCGAERHSWTTTYPKDENCAVKTEHYQEYFVKDVSIFKGCSTHIKPYHDLEKNVQMNGDTCDKGGMVIYSCKDCDYSFTDKFESHYPESVVVYFDKLGLCGGRAETHVCVICDEMLSVKL